MAVFMLLAGLAPVPFAFLYFPADLSIFLPRSVLKVAGGFLSFLFFFIPTAHSGHCRRQWSWFGLEWEARHVMDRKSLILIQWSTINSTISCTQDVLLQIISWWKFDISLPSVKQQKMWGLPSTWYVSFSISASALGQLHSIHHRTCDRHILVFFKSLTQGLIF